MPKKLNQIIVDADTDGFKKCIRVITEDEKQKGIYNNYSLAFDELKDYQQKIFSSSSGPTNEMITIRAND